MKIHIFAYNLIHNIMKKKKLVRFSLEDWQANPKRKVVTDDGRDVRIVCVDRMGEKFWYVKAMTYRVKLIESLIKAGYQRSYNANIFDKDLDDEEVSIRVMFNDYADNYADV